MSKPTKQQIHGAAFGYEPGRMKPVHFATGYFLAITGRRYRLEWLNKTAVTTHKDGLKDDYLPENLLDILRTDQKVSSRVDLVKLQELRQQINAAVDNDSAVFAAFSPYSQFGNDYTLTSARFVTDHKRLDGFAGYFISRVFERNDDGRTVREFSETWISQSADPLERFVTPLLDQADDADDWDNRYDGKFGELNDARLDAISAQMRSQTAAVAQLCRNLDANTPHHSRLRSLMLAVSTWLIAYLLRESANVSGQTQRLLLFMDFLGQPGTRCRSQSRASFARHREMLYRSYEAWNSAGRFAAYGESFELFRHGRSGLLDVKFLEQHFSDLSVRIGLAQPRASQVRQKHYECQPDTLRMLINSVLIGDELLPFPQLAERLKGIWGTCFGGCVDDHAELQEAGYLGLDEDDDLRANREAVVKLLKTMDLAVEPSDGLVLCAIDNELLP
jgi:hypothetical protein